MNKDPATLDHRQYESPSFPIESLLQHVYEQQQHGSILLIWNRHDKIIYLSQQLIDYLQINRTELFTLKWTDIIDAEHVREIPAHFQRSQDACSVSDLYFTLKDEDSDRFYGSVDIFTVEETYYICELQPQRVIEELKKCMINNDKMTLSNQLTASFVHEIRNPLTSLKGFLQLIRSGIAQKEEYYKVINSEIEKLEKITTELLQMARPNHTNKKNECTRELVEAVVLLLRTHVDMRNIEFNLCLDDGIDIYCNAIEVKQALFNLIKNGAEAMDKSGKITIQVYQTNNEVMIDIMDEGIGMKEETVKQWNQPYYTTKVDGTGLGLVITEHIIQDHGGLLKVSSTENLGTTFTIVFPAI
jgi:two-component system sporulation sensor kinase A